MTFVRGLVIAGSLALFLALALSAQEVETPDVIPSELALALLASGFDRSPQVLVGRMPDGLPGSVVPAGARILGSLVHQVRGSGPTSIIAAVPRAPDVALAAYEAQLLRTGWVRTPFGPGGGFSSAPQAFCNAEGDVVAALAMPASEHESYLRINVSRPLEEAQSPCGRENYRGPPMANAVIPSLYAPAGALMHNPRLVGGGGESSEASARLETSMGVAELIDHFGAQLVRAGWNLDSQALGGTVAARTLRFQDPHGQDWLGLLTATAVPGTSQREVVFRVTRLSSAG